MINRSLFSSSRDALATVNEAGGAAIKMGNEEALASFAHVGCLSNRFYTTAETELKTLLELCDKCDPTFIAKTAISARSVGFMKDTPAVLAAYLAAKDPQLLEKVFSRICDNGKVLKKFVQVIRSGVVGKRGFGSVVKRAINNFLSSRTDSQLLYDSIGGEKEVSLEDVLRMTHPRPADRSRAAMYSWLRGAKVTADGGLEQEIRYRKNGTFITETRKYSSDELPQKLWDWISYKSNPVGDPPKVPIQMLMGMSDLTVANWEVIAKFMSWTEIRMNLNALLRHNAFDSPRIVEYVCRKLADPEEIARAKCFPYQLLAAAINVGPPVAHPGYFNFSHVANCHNDKGGKESDGAAMPKEVRIALELAMEEAIKNVPQIPGQVYVAVDTSGSMLTPITGHAYNMRNAPPPSKIKCIDVASLIASAIIRKNPMAKVMPFSTKVHEGVVVDPMSSVFNNVAKLTALGGGGTACSEPLKLLNSQNAEGNTIIFISDYESWADNSEKGTRMNEQWQIYKARCPAAKLICIDLIPRTNKQTKDDKDTLCVAGFGDVIFTIMEQFVNNKLSPEHFVGKIKEIEL